MQLRLLLSDPAEAPGRVHLSTETAPKLSLLRLRLAEKIAVRRDSGYVAQGRAATPCPGEQETASISPSLLSHSS